MNGEALSFKRAGSNRHPVDRLALVRERIKALQVEETSLKEEIGSLMGDADNLGGLDYIATKTRTERKSGLDEKTMKANGIDVERYRRPSTEFEVIRVVARVIDEDGEAA